MNVKSLNDLFIHAISDVYSVEKQLARALPKLARDAKQEDLVNAFRTHLEETQDQIERLEEEKNTDQKLRLLTEEKVNPQRV